MMKIRYDLADMLWHWGQAAFVLLLLLSGAAMHLPQGVPGISFHTAVQLHDLSAILLLGAFALGLWVRLVARSVRRRDLLGLGWQLLDGGDPMAARAPQTPVMRTFWKVLLGVLVPIQVLTGIGLWAVQAHPGLPGHLALSVVHLLGAWLLLSALFAHLYLITCRPDRLAGLRAMLVGRSAPDDAPDLSGEAS